MSSGLLELLATLLVFNVAVVLLAWWLGLWP